MAPDIFPSTGVYILSTKKVATGAVSSETLNFETELRQCNSIHSDGISAKYKIACDFHMIVYGGCCNIKQKNGLTKSSLLYI